MNRNRYAKKLSNPTASSGVSNSGQPRSHTGLRQLYAASCGEFNPKGLKTAAKAIGYTSVVLLVATGVAWATLDEQVEKATSLVLGKVATLVLGGGTLFGGGYSIVQGNIGKGMAIIGVGVITGIGIALAKSGVLFSLLT